MKRKEVNCSSAVSHHQKKTAAISRLERDTAAISNLKWKSALPGEPGGQP
jgi:hypothetical protein